MTIDWFYALSFLALSCAAAFALGRFCRRGSEPDKMPLEPGHQLYPANTLPERICVSGEDYARIAEMVENPPKPTLALIDLMTGRPMTAEEREQQRRSFAFGNVSMSNPNVTRELVDAVADAMAEKK